MVPPREKYSTNYLGYFLLRTSAMKTAPRSPILRDVRRERQSLWCCAFALRSPRSPLMTKIDSHPLLILSKNLSMVFSLNYGSSKEILKYYSSSVLHELATGGLVTLPFLVVSETMRIRTIVLQAREKQEKKQALSLT